MQRKFLLSLFITFIFFYFAALTYENTNYLKGWI